MNTGKQIISIWGQRWNDKLTILHCMILTISKTWSNDICDKHPAIYVKEKPEESGNLQSWRFGYRSGEMSCSQLISMWSHMGKCPAKKNKDYKKMLSSFILNAPAILRLL